MCGARILALRLISTLAYPQFWQFKTAEFMRKLQPGDPFEIMSIDRFQNKSFRTNCRLSTSIPPTGFEVNTLYSVSVETNEPGGVGHVIISSTGAFQQEPSRPSAACTMYAEKHSLRSWQWMSPTDANSSSFFAVCVTGYGGLAYVADALTVFRDGQPQEICSPSNSTAVLADCHCLAVDGDFGNSKICSAGACCWEDLQCRHCSGGLGCLAKAERPWRALNYVLVLVFFVLSCVHATVVWNHKRRRFGQLGEEHGQQIEIPHSDSHSSCRAVQSR
ncbi:unnamed protein product [Symbiodinium sp. CCMP2592]|nr:unnamed protein product [Symbiodinium sp. CCMP2592]